MNSGLKIIALTLLIVIFQSCNSNRDQKASEITDSLAAINTTAKLPDRKSDSVALRNLLIAIYKWYEKNEYVNHNNLMIKSRIMGIDTVKLDSAIQDMKKTDFFSNEFLKNYKQIGLRVNQMMERDSTLSMVGIAFPFQDYDTWNGSQGTVPGWIDDITIHDLSLSATSSSLSWMVKNDSMELSPMKVKFKREKGKWKLTFLEFMDLNMYK